MSDINITDTEWRDIYTVYRAMHDGACPQCGYHSDGSDFVQADGLACPKCAFAMTTQEIKLITAQSGKILERRLSSFRIFSKLLEDRP